MDDVVDLGQQLRMAGVEFREAIQAVKLLVELGMVGGTAWGLANDRQVAAEAEWHRLNGRIKIPSLAKKRRAKS